MTYLSDRARKRPLYILYITAVVVLFVVVFFWPDIRSFIYKRIEPTMVIYGNTKNLIKGTAQTVPILSLSKSDLILYNKELELTIEYLENILANEKGVKREDLLLEMSSSTKDTIVLYPLAEDITKIYSTLLFNKGKESGLYEGQIVFIRGMQPVCRLVSVYDVTSLCSLFSKGGEITEGILVSGNSTSTVNLSLVGEGGGSYSVVLPKEISINVGDEVYLRSEQHMKLGNVVSITKDDQAIGSKVYIKGEYNPLSSSIFYIQLAKDTYEN